VQEDLPKCLDLRADEQRLEVVAQVLLTPRMLAARPRMVKRSPSIENSAEVR
jgi:hypothetical protein